MSLLVVDLWRHGALTGAPCLNGRSDVAADIDDARRLADAVALRLPDAILSSPLQRCRQPAQLAAERLAMGCATEPALTEWDFGNWDGLSLAQLHRDQGDAVAAFWQAPHDNPPPQGETLAQFQRRVLAWWYPWRQSAQGHHALLTHGGVIRILVADVLGLTPAQFGGLLRLGIDYGSRTTLSLWREGGVCHSHIQTVNYCSSARSSND